MCRARSRWIGNVVPTVTMNDLPPRALGTATSVTAHAGERRATEVGPWDRAVLFEDPVSTGPKDPARTGPSALAGWIGYALVTGRGAGDRAVSFRSAWAGPGVRKCATSGPEPGG